MRDVTHMAPSGMWCPLGSL